MKICKNYFNMIEVTLAIAVVGIGIAGIMSLFPVGIESSRDALYDNYATNVADRFIGYIQRAADVNWSVVSGLPTSKPGSESSSANWPPGDELEDNIYSTATAGLFGVKVVNSKGFNDFAADVKIWRTGIKAPVYDGSWQLWEDDDAEFGIGLNIELSWPLEKHYDNNPDLMRRTTRHYYIEIFKKQ